MATPEMMFFQQTSDAMRVSEAATRDEETHSQTFQVGARDIHNNSTQAVHSELVDAMTTTHQLLHIQLALQTAMLAELKSSQKFLLAADSALKRSAAATPAAESTTQTQQAWRAGTFRQLQEETHNTATNHTPITHRR